MKTIYIACIVLFCFAVGALADTEKYGGGYRKPKPHRPECKLGDYELDLHKQYIYCGKNITADLIVPYKCNAEIEKALVCRYHDARYIRDGDDDEEDEVDTFDWDEEDYDELDEQEEDLARRYKKKNCQYCDYYYTKKGYRLTCKTLPFKGHQYLKVYVKQGKKSEWLIERFTSECKKKCKPHHPPPYAAPKPPPYAAPKPPPYDAPKPPPYAVPPPPHKKCDLSSVSFHINHPYQCGKAFTATLKTTSKCDLSSGGALVCDHENRNCRPCSRVVGQTPELTFYCTALHTPGKQIITATYQLGHTISTITERKDFGCHGYKHY